MLLNPMLRRITFVGINKVNDLTSDFFSGTFDSDTDGTFQSDTSGTFHSAEGGTFVSDTSGTFIPILSISLIDFK